MKQNKNKKIIIIGIIVLAILLIIGIVYAFVATDLMKSNKDLFFKYASQIFDEQNGFGDKRLDQYNEKKKGTVYENYGEFKANLNSENLDQNTLDSVNNLNISFVGNIDNPNNKMEELIKINYSDDVNFPISYKKIDDSYGIKLNKVAKQYLVIENSNLSELFKKLGISNISIPDSIDMSIFDSTNVKLSDEESNQIKEVYWKNIQDSLEDANFTKVSTAETDGYALEISSQKFKEIVIQILETLKTDEIMLNKLNKLTGQDLAQSDIEELVENINSMEVQDGNAVITIHQSKGILKKLEIQIDEQAKIEISKNSNDDELSYDIQITSNIDEQNISASLSIKYTGLQNLEDVKESYNVIISDGYEYNIENEIKFIDSVEITNFASKDSIILNDLEAERLNNILEQVGNKIQEVNQEQMKELKIEGDNPLMYLIPDLSQGLSFYNSNQELLDNDTENETNTNTVPQGGVEEVSKSTFNSKFTQYEGNEIKGSDVKSLVMEIIANNMADEDRQVEVTGDIKITGEEVPDNIETSKNYTVKCEYNEDGYINKIEITEQ